MLNLTHQERQVALFLITVTLIGIGINFLAKKYSKVRVIAGLYQDLGKVNLNTADKDLLMSIPGIGDKLAQRIIEYRQRHAGFKELEELKSLKGITGYRFEKIKDCLIIK